MKIKVCGLYNEQNLEQVLALAPDYIGLNFYKESKRFCSWETLPDIEFGNTERIGIFVNASAEEVSERVDCFKLTLVQLHGTESLEAAQAIKKKIKKAKLIKVFGIEDKSDLDSMSSWLSISDYFLFDKKAVSFGGTGQKFSWDILATNPPSKDFFLAGGIGPSDARALKALSKVMPQLFAADVNSRFEDKDGLKDIKSLSSFIAELRA